MRKVTENDFRKPEFQGKDPDDYEFRADGKIVRKDRWETAIHDIRRVLGDTRDSFEVADMISAVEALVNAIPERSEEVS